MLYLLHATIPLVSGRHPGASHYLGWTTPERLQTRLATHRRGEGSKLTQALSRLPGQTLLLVRVWPDGDRHQEYRLHHGAHLRRYCPICNPRAPILLVPRQLRLLPSPPYKARSRKPVSGNGGAWPVGNPTGAATWFLLGLLLGSGTKWDVAPAATGETLGGTATSVPAPLSRARSGSPAGTRQPATYTTNTPTQPPVVATAGAANTERSER